MARDIQASDTRLDALAAQFDLPLEALHGYAELDYEHLIFGTKYKVAEDIASNQGDALRKGDKVYFLGATSDHDTDVSLYFERDGTHLTLRFNANVPQEADAKRYFRNIETTLRPVLLDLSKRSKQLIAARAVLLHLRKNEA